MRQTSMKPLLLAALVALFSLISSVAAPATAHADSQEPAAQPASPHEPGTGLAGDHGVRPIPANAPRPAQNNELTPHQAHASQPATRTVTYEESTPIDEKSTYIGGIVTGSMLIATGVAMGVTSLLVESDAKSWSNEARVAVGATGATAVVIGAVVVGIAGYHLHTWKSENSEVSIDVTPAYHGAGVKFTF